MEQHEFSALLTFDPAAREDAVQRYLHGARSYGIVQPCSGPYFPAAICCCGPFPPQRRAHAVVRILLLAGEAEVFFMVGQAFVVWSDAIVGDDIVKGNHRLGDGVIVSQELAVPCGACDKRALRPAVRRPLPDSRAIEQHRGGHGMPAVAWR